MITSRIEILAPLSGFPLPLTHIPDPLFSQGLLGKGWAINPTEGQLHSPCSGKVQFIHPAMHALTLSIAPGVEILIHIGIDSVALKGDGFRCHIKTGDLVRPGQLLIQWDMDKVARGSKSSMTPIIFQTQSSWSWESELKFGEWIPSCDPLGYIVFGETSEESKSFPDSKTSTSTVSKTNAQSLRQNVFLNLPHGLHARPAARIVNWAKDQNAQYSLHFNSKQASLRSLTALLQLGVSSPVQLEISSPDANKTEMKVAKNFLENLTETSTENSPRSPDLSSIQTSFVDRSITSAETKFLLRGQSASTGLAQGPLYILKPEKFEFTKDNLDPMSEILKLDSILQSVKTLSEAKMKSETSQARDILKAQLEFLEDPDFITGIRELIQEERASAAWAWNEKIQEASRALENSESKLLAERASDLRDIGKIVLRSLLAGEVKMDTGQEIPSGSIIFSEEINPSLVLLALRSGAKGLLSEKGGKTSHASILAKSAELPFIYGLEKSQLAEFHSQQVLMNADEGFLWLKWTDVEAQKLNADQKRKSELRAQYDKKKNLPALTRDGTKILVSANVGSTQSLGEYSNSGADGIGLFRTEFLFLERTQAPTEEEQTREYQKFADQIKDAPFVIRTVDIGGDKQIPYLPQPLEENPFLGVRGLRLSMKEKSLFESQLRALAKIKYSGKISLMFPMVTDLSEFLIAKGLAEEIFSPTSLDVEYGIMIEVPSAALLAGSFAKYVDFFSIGTNDLTQYTLAADRGNTGVDEIYDHFHPAVLKLIELTSQGTQLESNKNKIWLGVCGSMASDPLATPLLLGLGVTELSANPRQIPGIKEQVRGLTLSQCKDLTSKCLRLSSAQEVRKLLKSFLEIPRSKEYQL